MIKRTKHINRVKDLLSRFPVVSVVGARQVGKTTLAKEVASGKRCEHHFFDLEDPADIARLEEPMLMLRDLKGLIVLDEIQTRQDLFPVLRVLADRTPPPARFLILGSASPDLTKFASESLAGRVAQYQLGGFSLEEVGSTEIESLLLRGGFPRAFLADSDQNSEEWRSEFIRTFLCRDIPQLGFSIPPMTMRRFWTMLAHYHGQRWNASELGRSFGVADTTVRRYLDILSSTYTVTILQPWEENIKKRQRKAPKIYISDSGLLHSLLNLKTMNDLLGHPKCGASWEGFALFEVIRNLNVRQDNYYYWATQSEAELDLLVNIGKERIGFEFKRTDAPKTTRSMHSALKDLKLDLLYVIHAGEHTFPLGKRITALPLSKILNHSFPSN